MPTVIPPDRAIVAAMTAGELDALATALDVARTLVDDVRDERSPQSHCGRWDHPGHHWTRYGRSRYCWGDGPFLDREARGRCGADWPHPGHDMGDHRAACPGVPADPQATRYRHVVQWKPSDLARARMLIGTLVAEGIEFRHPSGTGDTTTLLLRTPQGDLLADPGDWLVRPDDGDWRVMKASPLAAEEPATPRDR
ncbi:hypothetical protein [Streptomyces sp. NPDC002553]|uniref:hypothetical protein n=1 Tax=Streptomyces sp. NPDC002553 TaxID=3154417 RepID=UPI003321625F